ncbi:MAG: hypothetical protein SFV15_23820 [Polyangiaceae bacterium]|nr:hypothetical protein [Polyangiaceae bacterium]
MKAAPFRWLGLGVSLVVGSALASPSERNMELPQPLAQETVRGVTIGPIENSLHPGRGYGSPAYEKTLDEAARMGATWVSLTPFGRVWDLTPSGISSTFEAPFEANRKQVALAIEQAHTRGLKVMLVPHLWVETGGWRAEIEPEGDAGWRAWADSYERFVLSWAEVAELKHADLFSMGVELRSWVTTTRAPLFSRVIRSVKRRYSGMLTYAANWDDAEDTSIWGELDVIGINAFYPLGDKDGASPEALMEGGRRVAQGVRSLSERWQKPVLFTEFGYTTRTDPAIRPWEWPEHLGRVEVNEAAQADAYRALLSAMTAEPRFMGFFVWRLYADPNDTSQEPAWGFSPRAKLAETVLREAFSARWASDPTEGVGAALLSKRAMPVGIY